MIDTLKLTNAFKSMRKLGLIAKQKYLCCRNCAGYAIANRVEQMSEDKRRKIKGVVTYNRQDAVCLYDHKNMYVSYGVIETIKFGNVGLSTKQVGELAVRCLNDAGLNIKWDGNPTMRILILSNKNM